MIYKIYDEEIEAARGVIDHKEGRARLYNDVGDCIVDAGPGISDFSGYEGEFEEYAPEPTMSDELEQQKELNAKLIALLKEKGLLTDKDLKGLI